MLLTLPRKSFSVSYVTSSNPVTSAGYNLLLVSARPDTVIENEGYGCWYASLLLLLVDCPCSARTYIKGVAISLATSSNKLVPTKRILVNYLDLRGSRSII